MKKPASDPRECFSNDARYMASRMRDAAIRAVRSGSGRALIDLVATAWLIPDEYVLAFLDGMDEELEDPFGERLTFLEQLHGVLLYRQPVDLAVVIDEVLSGDVNAWKFVVARCHHLAGLIGAVNEPALEW